MRQNLLLRPIVVALLSATLSCRREAESARPPERQTQSSADEVQLGDKAQAFAGLQYAVATKASLERSVRTSGVIAWDPARVTDVGAPVRGRVLELRGTVGDRVQQGAVVAVIENPDNLDGRFDVRTTGGGVIVERASSAGAVVDAGLRLVRIVDDARLWLLVDIPPTSGDRPRIGSTVTADIPAAGAHVTGVIDGIIPMADSISHVAHARVRIANTNGALAAGMSALVTASVGGRVDAAVVPRSAVVTVGGRQAVFVPDSADAFRALRVELGMPVAPDDVAVIRGLTPGTRVVSVGAQQLANRGFNFKGLGDDEEDDDTP